MKKILYYIVYGRFCYVQALHISFNLGDSQVSRIVLLDCYKPFLSGMFFFLSGSLFDYF